MQTSAAFSIQNKQQISTTFQLEILFMLYARSLQNQVLIPVCRNLPIRAKRQLLAQNDPLRGQRDQIHDLFLAHHTHRDVPCTQLTIKLATRTAPPAAVTASGLKRKRRKQP